MSTSKLAVKVAIEQEFVLAPVLASEPCPVKQGLRAELRSTMDEIVALVVRQLDAVRFGAEPEVEQFLGLQIVHARRRKDSLLELYKSHLARHSC